MKTTVVLIAIGVLIYGSSLIYAEELANSGYPVNKANVERNNQINRAVSNPIWMHLSTFTDFGSYCVLRSHKEKQQYSLIHGLQPQHLTAY